MANLRGGTIAKQIKDAIKRLLAFGKSRHGEIDHLTHSNGLSIKREMYMRDWGDFMQRESLYVKVNEAMTQSNMDKFLKHRLEGLAGNTKESYIRGWSSLVQGLEEKNITIPIGRDYFDEKMEYLRDQGDRIYEPKTGRSIDEPEGIIERLYEKRYETGVYAQTMYELGIRSSESIKLLNESERYIVERDDGIYVEGLIGKGNHVYEAKEISGELVQKIEQLGTIPSYSTFYRDLKNEGINAHRFRFTYAKEELADKLSDGGKSYQDSLREVSKELNHHRGEMTEYYIKRG